MNGEITQNPSVMVVPIIKFDPQNNNHKRSLLINFQINIFQCKSIEGKIVYNCLYWWDFLWQWQVASHGC